MTGRAYKNPQVNLRLPIELKERIAELAETNGRSANAEMVAAIDAWAKQNESVEVLDLASFSRRLMKLEQEVEKLKNSDNKTHR